MICQNGHIYYCFYTIINGDNGCINIVTYNYAWNITVLSKNGLLQGVVTFIRPIEPFVTGFKIFNS